VANCGTAILAKIPVPPGAGMKVGDGVFMNRYNRSVYPSPLSTWNMTFKRVVDGTSKTLMLSENIQAGEYSSSAYFAPPPADTNTAVPLISDAQLLTGFVWDWDPAITASPPADERCINGKKNFGPRAPITTYYYSRPSSYHSGGVNVAMCDGSLIWLRENIEYKVYEQLMTSDGAKSNMQGPKTDSNSPINYVLNDQDYQ
jgi:prepilin-type processing-associated H-X9-DG protein